MNGTTYAAQEEETIVVSEELIKLNDLYKEGIITKEEFSKAKSLLLDPDSDKSQIKKKKKKLTAVERKRLKEAELDEAKALKEQLRAEKKAERDRVIAERNRIIAEKKKACSENPKSKECRTAKKLLTKILAEIRNKSSEEIKQDKEERVLEKQAAEERKKRIAKQKELEKQASLEEKAKNKAEKAARKAERKRLKAEWKKACSDDPESKACKEGKPSEKIKNVLKKIEKKLGG